MNWSLFSYLFIDKREKLTALQQLHKRTYCFWKLVHYLNPFCILSTHKNYANSQKFLFKVKKTELYEGRKALKAIKCYTFLFETESDVNPYFRSERRSQLIFFTQTTKI